MHSNTRIWFMAASALGLMLSVRLMIIMYRALRREKLNKAVSERLKGMLVSAER